MILACRIFACFSRHQLTMTSLIDFPQVLGACDFCAFLLMNRCLLSWVCFFGHVSNLTGINRSGFALTACTCNKHVTTWWPIASGLQTSCLYDFHGSMMQARILSCRNDFGCLMTGGRKRKLIKKYFLRPPEHCACSFVWRSLLTEAKKFGRGLSKGTNSSFAKHWQDVHFPWQSPMTVLFVSAFFSPALLLGVATVDGWNYFGFDVTFAKQWVLPPVFPGSWRAVKKIYSLWSIVEVKGSLFSPCK